MRPCVSGVADTVTGLESLSLTRGGIVERGRSVACVVSRSKLAPMPSVEMRRSTRVFVPKTKEAEGVKVLRSGRKVWVESGEAKIKVAAKVADGRDLFRLIGDSDEAAAGWKDRVTDEGGEFDATVLEEVGKTEPKLETRGLPSGLTEGLCLEKRFGVVYGRKRKRFGCSKVDPDVGDLEKCADRRFGLHFFHRKRRRTAKTSGSLEKPVDRFLCIYDDPSYGGSRGIAGVVSSVLRYMLTAKLGLVELSGFLQSQPVAGVFGSYGIRFLLSQQCNYRSRFCKIYGTREVTPLFDLNFSSVPHCFIHLHASMWFRSLRLSYMLLVNADRTDDDDDDDDDDDNDSNVEVAVLQCTSFTTHLSDLSDSRLIGNENSNPGAGGLKMLNSPFGLSRSAIRVPYRNGVVTRSSSQRRRKRSLRTRRARNPSFLGVHRGGSSVLDSGIRKNVGRFSSSVLTKHENRSVHKNSSDSDIKLLKSTLIALGKDIDSVSCSANLLFVESDRCYRESGARVTLELSTSNEWILAIRKDGSLRCYHRAQKGSEVKPTCTNRFTYAIIWCVDSGWKLEFTVRKDWAIFKELFKVCGDRNIVPPSPVKAIPIPGVFEVSDCGSSPDAPYVRPEAYIKMCDDELSRTMFKRSASYDMDSEDEKWLSTFKSELDLENDLSVFVTDYTFELMIDSFEKAAFCSPDDLTEKAPADLCSDLANREAVEAAYSYWMTKRKKKRAPLLRVFQLNESKKTPLVTKPVLRKKRSMKQRNILTAKATPSGRGKELRVLQAIAAEQNANEEKTAMFEVEQARAAARSALEGAIEKRRRAQTLMASADLAMYRAAMAVRIAEAAQAPEPDQAVAHFLD